MRMRISIIIVVLLTSIPTLFAAEPIDFDNLNIASTGYGVAAYEGATRLMAAYNNEIYFILSEDGTANPSKVYCYNPSDGLSNAVNHSIVAKTTGRFVTLRQINDLLYFSDTLGNVYSYDGSTLTAMSGTPFTANNYVSSIEEYNGLIYFGTSISSIYRYDGYTYEQVYGAINRVPIMDMAAWQKDGYLYVSVGPENVCCPPTGYTIRSNSGNAGSWETVFQDVWCTLILMPTPDYLYTAVMDSAYWLGSSIRKSSNGTSFPVINQSGGEYKVGWGSLYYDGIAYVFVGGYSNYRVIDENGLVSLVPNQNWCVTQAVELNGEIYALARVSSVSNASLPGDVYLITTAPEPAIAATVDIQPNTLNLKSKGNWITCYIAFPADADVADVNSNTILLNGQVKAEWTMIEEEAQVLMAKFSRSAVEGILQPGTVELTVSGKLNDGTRFEGKDTITVINKGKP